jgi:hypothetical protein
MESLLMIWTIYVSNSARKNFDIGLEEGVWGAKADSFKKADVGDYVVFVFALSWAGEGTRPKGYPRLREDDLENFNGKTKRVVIARINYSYVDDKTTVWPDDIYPYRFKFEFIRELQPNLSFGLSYCDSNFVGAVRKSLLSKGVISSVEIDSIDDLYLNSTTSKEEQNTLRLNLANSLTIKGKNEISPSLGVKELSETLGSIIVNQPDDSGMMVGIFGEWGRGKTYLAEHTWKAIKKSKPKFRRIVFSAWKYQDTKSSWAYLYQSLLDEYLHEGETKGLLGKIKNSPSKLWKLFKLNIVSHSIVPLLSIITAIWWIFFVDDKFDMYYELFTFLGAVTVFQILYFYFRYSGTITTLFSNYFSKKDFSNFLGLQAEVEDSITSLLRVWIKKADRNKKVVLFVDDIDRCNIEQILNIIDGLRVILDNDEINQRLIIITAVDERMLQRSLRYKYEQFEKGFEVGSIFKEYLEKIFIVGLKLNPLSEEEIQDFLNNILPLPINNVNSTDVEENKVQKEAESDENTGDDEDFDDEENIEVVDNTVDDHDLDILPDERQYLLKEASKLENATPRKIRIFYYKYLILKKLLIIKLEKDALLNEWDNIQDEHIIIDVLIHSTNGKKVKSYLEEIDSPFLTREIKDTIEYVVLMVSVL